MDETTKRNLSLSGQVKELGYEIANDIDHGECFYDEGMLRSFLANLDKLKDVAVKLYETNHDES